MINLKRILASVKQNDGFLNESTVRLIAEQQPLRQVLVRCGGGRFTCAVQDVQHFIDIIAESKKDYVRDVSLPTTDPIWNE